MNAVADLPYTVTRQRDVVDALRRLLPERCVLFNDEDVRPYECDGLAAYRQMPMVVALPESEAQLVQILQLCRDMKLPIVPRGAGTGLSGGATPIADGLVLSTAKLNRIIKVDPVSRTAVVQPGVRNLAISDAAAPHNLYYAPDPSSQIACSIGGNVAENSGGVHCLKYGLTVHNVMRVRIVTIDGDIVELGNSALDAPGLDLLAVFIGSEGMLGIVTEVTVRLIPKPQQACVIMASFDDVVKGGNAVADVIGAGIIPAGLEMMDRTSSRMVEPFVKAGYDIDAAAILLCESDGTPEEVSEEIARMTAILTASGATKISVSGSDEERMRFWSGRKNAFPAAGRISPDYYCMDGTIPRKRLADVLLRIGEMEVKYGLRCANVFHAGDGNLHPLILFDANKPGEFHQAEAFGAEILELCVEVGGTITGEHGVGIEKINSMCVQYSPQEREAFFAVKRAFDTAFLLNPDKAIPSLHRCAEYGKMHVQRGQLKFPDLPRF
ncbi:FAD-linked oxidase C-terminal domain-containing protein [Actimicrobium sp. CCC2.4]|uniref:FAD-linked oxidase C-terminal domain-containing protein n=1 Tax=Actimicrobium sp. CCC2.4 TaxID=3048606 RepID=UPI002AC8CCC4|nr:FAD-linked oxidase C-terminal domain-containing protein [Actimicrobium sp. CCC2.4]MEB0134892.1 FAD-linked oxidase C-terminal domain-containing protein [Actimicrobium sp. CCC2.4]WPX32056.1 FAD-linked oxidase C-terminal domain-containing protein [Actimicrobium sp. CCC2.4]